FQFAHARDALLQRVLVDDAGVARRESPVAKWIAPQFANETFLTNGDGDDFLRIKFPHATVTQLPRNARQAGELSWPHRVDRLLFSTAFEDPASVVRTESQLSDNEIPRIPHCRRLQGKLRQRLF